MNAGEETRSPLEIKELIHAEEIIKLLECPICDEVPYGAIWLCENGHNLCDSCRSQLLTCGLCRERFTGGRNHFMESIILGSKLTCPYQHAGCTQVIKGDEMKKHVADCGFGPKIKWVQVSNGQYPHDSVQGGNQNGVALYVMRAPHNGSITPGKLYEYSPPGNPEGSSRASLAWGGGEHWKMSYEVLVAPPESVKWIASSNGELVPGAVRGGTSEAGEPLYIGRVKYGEEGEDIIIGKIHPSHSVCYIGIEIEMAFAEYEILVANETPKIVVVPDGTGNGDVESPMYS